MPAIAPYLVALLIVRCADDHFVTDSYSTLAQKCGRGEAAIEAALEFLVGNQWVQKDWLNGKTLRLTLTAKYLSFVGDSCPSEVTPDAIAFAEWFRNLQRKNLALIRYQKKIDSKREETAQHLNAARIVKKCGSVERAKEMTLFSLSEPKRKSRVLQNIHDLSKLVHQPTFIAAFENRAQEQNVPPDVPQPATQLVTPERQPAPVVPPQKTPEEILESLQRKFSYQLARMDSYRGDKASQDSIRPQLTDAADVLARHAMSIGISPRDLKFPEGLEREKYFTEWAAKSEEVLCQN